MDTHGYSHEIDSLQPFGEYLVGIVKCQTCEVVNVFNSKGECVSDWSFGRGYLIMSTDLLDTPEMIAALKDAERADMDMSMCYENRRKEEGDKYKERAAQCRAAYEWLKEHRKKKR